MPTFTAIALENLLDPDSRDSSPETKNRLPLKRQPPLPQARRPSHVFVSPALYATPKSTPAPTSPVSVSPSPYVVVNRRRREVREPANRRDGFQLRGGDAEKRIFGGEEDVPLSSAVPEDEGFAQGGGVEEGGPVLEVEEEAEGGGVEEGGPVLEVEEEAERFAEENDAASVASCCVLDDEVVLQRDDWKHVSVSGQTEFFDAPEGD